LRARLGENAATGSATRPRHVDGLGRDHFDGRRSAALTLFVTITGMGWKAAVRTVRTAP
jgi:hypothetical protein